ncbi:uncharacterized protein LOC125045273 [Penaeus chinensis]|uniref:uncharacterized protein LOC125045273 n=1 Tax=Penaeus chinensis TaxID=139456 RepID=UPI001FB7418C|nr:uncharacterized protein LOC125045273 [Penaeus chinensis]
MNTIRDEKMYLRARIGRNMKCPKCHTSYRTDNRRSPNRRAPVLLSCGHSCCETCAQSALLYICSLCNEDFVKNAVRTRLHLGAENACLNYVTHASRRSTHTKP